MSEEEVDRTRVEALAVKLMIAVRRELHVSPPSRDNVLVALNAVAVTAASLIAGTGDVETAREFFDTAVAQNIAQLLEDGTHG